MQICFLFGTNHSHFIKQQFQFNRADHFPVHLSSVYTRVLTLIGDKKSLIELEFLSSKKQVSILPVNQADGGSPSSCLHLHKHKVHCDTDMFIDDENNEGSDENINYFSDDS